MKRQLLVFTFCASLLGTIFLPTAQANPATQQAFLSPNGAEGNNQSYSSTISADGRFAAFYSYASNLVPGDTNNVPDVFVRDLQNNITERVSISSTGTEGNKGSFGYAMSADGRFVAFLSSATNLVAGDTNNSEDIFVRDRQTGSTERVSVGAAGIQSNGIVTDFPAISANGRFVVFYAYASNLAPGDTNNGRDVYVRDRQTGSTERVSVNSMGIGSNGDSFDSSLAIASISADGRFVAFNSLASNLVAGDTNAFRDIFVHDRQTGSTERVSVSSTNTEANQNSYFPAISADGRFVTFWSYASNLVSGDSNNAADVFVRDLKTGITERVSVDAANIEGNNASYASAITADGRFVSFSSEASNLVAGDNNNVRDVFVRDRQTGSTERVSVNADGIEGNDYSLNPSLSADGRFVTFESGASNLVPHDTNSLYDSFVRDRQSGSIERISVSSDDIESDNQSYNLPSLSADGRFVAFESYASNLVPDDTNNGSDIFVRDRQTGITERVSVSSTGTQADSESHYPSLSADGRFVAFSSLATNLVPDNTNIWGDVFVHDRQTGSTERVSISSAGTKGNNYSYNSAISSDGRFVAFQSVATNLVPDDTNQVEDTFIHDRQTGSTERISVSSTGTQANDAGTGANSTTLAISSDGRFVAFVSYATNLVPDDTNNVADVFVRDWQMGTTERVSVSSTGTESDNVSLTPVISADGRYVGFVSYATNLVPNDTNNFSDVFIRDRQTGTTERVSVSATGTQANQNSSGAAISPDGRFVTFGSGASNLVPNDTDQIWQDIFVRDRQNNTVERVSVSSTGTQANNSSEGPAISPDGRFVVFQSLASNLVPGDTNKFRDVFVRDRQNNTTERLSIGVVVLDAPTLLVPANGLVTLNTKPLFTWSTVPRVDHYEMRLDTVNPPAKIVYIGQSLTYTPPSPLKPTTYYWQVAAVDENGNAWSIETRTITIISLENAAPPRNYFTTSTPTLTWNRVTTAARYEIQVDNTLNFNSALDFSASVPADQLSVITPSLANNTYYWHVRACPATGACGTWSATDSFVVDS